MNEDFMKLAIQKAQKSGNDIPVGAVIVKDEKILACACNEKEKTDEITAHAEIIAIRTAEKLLKNWRLEDCELYVTLEPCPMCAWAILQSRIKAVYFGSYDNQYGAMGSKLNLSQISNSKILVRGGILENECDKLLKDYFRCLRI